MLALKLHLEQNLTKMVKISINTLSCHSLKRHFSLRSFSDIQVLSKITLLITHQLQVLWASQGKREEDIKSIIL